MGWQHLSGSCRRLDNLFDDLDPIGRFAKDWLVEDAASFVTSEEIVIQYAAFLTQSEQDAEIDQRELMSRLKALPGAKRVTRMAGDGRQRGLSGYKWAAHVLRT